MLLEKKRRERNVYFHVDRLVLVELIFIGCLTSRRRSGCDRISLFEYRISLVGEFSEDCEQLFLFVLRFCVRFVTDCKIDFKVKITVHILMHSTTLADHLQISPQTRSPCKGQLHVIIE